MSPADATLIANVRAEVESGADIVTVDGRVAIFPDQIVALSDDELLAFIARRLAEH
jgi:hypothetical protein